MWEMTKLEPTPTALTSDGLGYVIICIFIKIFCWQLYVVATDADLTFFFCLVWAMMFHFPQFPARK